MGLVLQMMSDCLPICSSVQYCVDLYVSNKEKTTKCKSEPEFIVSLCNFIVPPQTGQTEIGSVRSKEDRECCWRFKSQKVSHCCPAILNVLNLSESNSRCILFYCVNMYSELWCCCKMTLDMCIKGIKQETTQKTCTSLSLTVQIRARLSQSTHSVSFCDQDYTLKGRDGFMLVTDTNPSKDFVF